MLTPRSVKELLPQNTRTADLPALVAEGEDRRRRMAPYDRASQRELVRASIMADGRFDDFHGRRA